METRSSAILTSCLPVRTVPLDVVSLHLIDPIFQFRHFMLQSIEPLVQPLLLNAPVRTSEPVIGSGIYLTVQGGESLLKLR